MDSLDVDDKVDGVVLVDLVRDDVVQNGSIFVSVNEPAVAIVTLKRLVKVVQVGDLHVDAHACVVIGRKDCR